MKRARMTEWFSPLELVRHAPDVLVSLLMGRRADPRLVEALAVPDAGVEDCSRDEADQPLQEIWLDYVADSGDGWDSTYAVASAVAQPALTLRDSKGVVHPTDRGSVLVFGGDQIYPSPSRKRYKQKFVRPFETALGWTESPHPKAFAIPGNHDWYDGLVAFTRLFCSRDWVGGWQTPQRQSYFALKLPQHWWLIGTDVQLGSDLDQPQIDFFRRVADEMEAEDRVILCTAEPHWIYAHLYEKYDKDVYRESNLRFLEEEILRKGKKHGGRVEVFLSGDLHHYRRHESAEGKQKITAGGGGAALHPTHGLDVSELSDGFRLKAAFPPKNVSARLTWQNLVFAVRNPTFLSLRGRFAPRARPSGGGVLPRLGRCVFRLGPGLPVRFCPVPPVVRPHRFRRRLCHRRFAPRRVSAPFAQRLPEALRRGVCSPADSRLEELPANANRP